MTSPVEAPNHLSNIFRLASALGLGEVDLRVRSFVDGRGRAYLLQRVNRENGVPLLGEADGATPEIAIRLLEQQLTDRLTQQAEQHERAAEAARKAIAEVQS